MGRNLVTGGMGFLGSYIIRQLLTEGEEVIAFQRRDKLPASMSDIKDKVEIISGDISNWVHVADAVKRSNVNCIYHLAAVLFKPCEASAAAGFSTNIVGTFNVLEAARILGVKNVAYVSSVATYGFPPPRKVFNDTPQKAESMYGTTKICCERLGEQYHRQYGLNFRGIRVVMIVGPTREISYYFGDWSGVIEETAKGKPYTIHSDPNIPCGYIYGKDVARALIELKKAPENKLRQRIYNCSGFMATLNDVVGAVKKYIPDAQINFEWDQSQEMKDANLGEFCDFDNTTAYEDFGYQPRYLLDEMVKDFINEVRSGKAG